ncbi:Gfo/Idh/MocA family oxidoreductase [uncultured Alteromonas sp.]|jgi:predicted dehydrogenase|uniref:Gfo/Idh/MocA family oxidoreductase n=1 Tax=uncultured Alteromonas sp. TaxID=179113 RepID=UPI0025CEF06F|nr:Gfo/Idh/MocA family oxidoreductase [uncultured Alteromonas sp.]
MALSVLIVGFGYAAKTFHVPFLQAMEAYSIAGVVSSDPAKVESTLPGVEVYNSFDQAIAEGHFDLVVITTPNHLHAPQAEAALRAGCHVLVEKPFTLSSERAEQLVALAAQLNKQLCVFHNRRFDGDFLTLEQLIAEQAVGDIKRLESRFDRFRPTPRKRWRENAGPGSGIFWDLGPHLIDQVVQLFGMPQQVSADIRILRDGGESDDAFEVTLHYSNITVLLGSSPFEAGPTLRYALQGTKGSYRKYHLDPQEDQLKASLSFDDPDWSVAPAPQYGKLYLEAENKTVATLNGGYITFYSQLATALVTNNAEALPASGQSVVTVIRLIELARLASEQQQTLSVECS